MLPPSICQRIQPHGRSQCRSLTRTPYVGAKSRLLLSVQGNMRYSTLVNTMPRYIRAYCSAPSAPILFDDIDKVAREPLIDLRAHVRSGFSLALKYSHALVQSDSVHLLRDHGEEAFSDHISSGPMTFGHATCLGRRVTMHSSINRCIETRGRS